MEWIDRKAYKFKYIVKEPTVTCIIEMNVSKLFNKLDKDLQNANNNVKNIATFIISEYSIIEYEDICGVATCKPGDTFDLETGKKIAFRKAYQKYYSAILQNLDDLYASVDRIEMFLARQRKRERKKYNKLTGYNLLKDRRL